MSKICLIALILVLYSNISFAKTNVSIQKQDGYLIIKSNGIPNHKTGQFPGSGGPHAISEQSYNFKLSLNPKKSNQITKVRNNNLFGVALNGVPFDPGTAEYWNRDRNSGWVEEGIVNGRKLLGIDISNAHVQPNGAYHYHAEPPISNSKHIGYAADGFKIYSGNGRYKSSYKLKSGSRPGGSQSPSGRYDGKYTQDFEYIKGHGNLDECNGISLKTGEYIYLTTDGFPYIPRCWVGDPDPSFEKKMGRRGQGRRGPPSRHGHHPPPRR